jgi:basic membrane lipoprotein Med (substrate-binding protein (PBP1-ABC) superfamily)
MKHRGRINLVNSLWPFFLLVCICLPHSEDPAHSWGVLALRNTPIQSGTAVKLCFLYFGPLSDLGWTFTYNVARLDAHTALTARYKRKNITFDSRFYYPNAFRLYPNKTNHTIQMIQEGCRIILSNNRALLGDDDKISKLYPNVSFVLVNHNRLGDTSLENVAYVGFNARASYYLKGIAAGHVAKRKICFLAGYESSALGRNANDAVNGFLIGIRRVNVTIPIEVISMNSWFWPVAEVEIATLYLQRGCDVIGRYSDAFNLDNVVASKNAADNIRNSFDSLPNETNPFASTGVLTVGPHSNLQLFVGDSVLVSSFLDWTTILEPILVDIVETGNPNLKKSPFFYGLKSGGLIVSALSPRAPVAAVKAFEEERARVLTPGVEEEPVCGPGWTLRTSRQPVTYLNGTRCLTAIDGLLEFIDVGNVLFHPDFKYIDQCPPGTFGRYRTENITLECVPCPVNTYSSVSGSRSCTPCADGTETASLGATICSPKDQLEIIVPPIVLCSLAGLLICIFVVFRCGRARPQKKAGSALNLNAPRQPPFFVVSTSTRGVEGLELSFSLKRAMSAYQSIVYEATEIHNGYLVKRVEEDFLIAFKSPIDAALFANYLHLAISRFNDDAAEEALRHDRERTVARERQAKDRREKAKRGSLSKQEAQRKPGRTNTKSHEFAVRVALHHCTKNVLVRFHPEREYYDYAGSDIHTALDLAQVARQGETLMTRETMEEILADNDFPVILAREVELRFVGIIKSIASDPLEGHRAASVEISREDSLSNEGSSSSASSPRHGGESRQIALFSLIQVELASKKFPFLRLQSSDAEGITEAVDAVAPRTMEDSRNRRSVSNLERLPDDDHTRSLSVTATTLSLQRGADALERQLGGSNNTATTLDWSPSLGLGIAAMRKAEVQTHETRGEELLEGLLRPLSSAERRVLLQRIAAAHEAAMSASYDGSSKSSEERSVTQREGETEGEGPDVARLIRKALTQMAPDAAPRQY